MAAKRRIRRRQGNKGHGKPKPRTKFSKRKRIRMKGGAVRKYKRRKIDDIVEVMSMILSGPKPSFGSMGMLLGKQVFKGGVDNVIGLLPYIQGGL